MKLFSRRIQALKKEQRKQDSFFKAQFNELVKKQLALPVTIVQL